MNASNITGKTTMENRPNNTILPLIPQFHNGILTLQEGKQKPTLGETTKNLVKNSLVHNNHKNGIIPWKKLQKNPLFRSRSHPAASIKLNIKNNEKNMTCHNCRKREPLRKMYLKKIEVCRSESFSIPRISTTCHSIDENTLEIRTKELCQQLQSNMFLKRDLSLNTSRTSKDYFSKPSRAESRRCAVVFENARIIHQQMLHLDVRK